MKNRCQRIKKVLAIYNITMLLFLLSCNPIKQSSEIITLINTNQITEDGVVLRIHTNKTVFKPGETIRVDASIGNTSENIIEYRTSPEDLKPSVYVEDNPYFTRFGLWEKQLKGAPTLLAMTEIKQLKPDGIKRRQVVWDQKIEQKIQAPKGEYSIKCSIDIVYNQDLRSVKTISTDLHIKITGAKEWITQEQAKNIALNLPEVKKWQETHTGNNIVKEENGNYYVCIHNEWQQVSPQFTIFETENLNLNELKEWVPKIYVLLENGQWTVSTGTKLGLNPHFVRITINLETGSVVSKELTDE
jgi:hypothetical protein